MKKSLYGPFGFDAAWLIAIALNSSINKLSNTRSLNIMDLRENNAAESIKDSLLNARFSGVTVSNRHDLQRQYVLTELT